jgi:protein AbiQ
MSDKKIVFHQLSPDFYREHTHLAEMIDKGRDKGRGYGVLLVNVLGYKFAIPVRSKMAMKHPGNFTTKIHSPEGKNVRHGLDYTKAVIITDDRFINTQKEFMLVEKSDYVKINDNEHKIIADFEKFVRKYIKAVNKNDRNILNDYRFSTLVNYHKELGCSVPETQERDTVETA